MAEANPGGAARELDRGLDAFRGYLIRTRTLLPLPVEVELLLVFMVVMLLLGARAFAGLERRVRVRGTLGQH